MRFARHRVVLALIGTLAMAMLASAPAVLAHGGHGQEKKHHTLRGKIVSVNLEEKSFYLDLGEGKETVVCWLHSKSRLRRDGKEIRLEDLHPGARVRCRCAEHADGRHYSLDLLVVESPRK